MQTAEKVVLNVKENLMWVKIYQLQVVHSCFCFSVKSEQQMATSRKIVFQMFKCT